MNGQLQKKYISLSFRWISAILYSKSNSEHALRVVQNKEK